MGGCVRSRAVITVLLALYNQVYAGVVDILSLVEVSAEAIVR